MNDGTARATSVEHKLGPDDYGTIVKLDNGGEFRCDSPDFMPHDQLTVMPDGSIMRTGEDFSIFRPIWIVLPGGATWSLG